MAPPVEMAVGMCAMCTRGFIRLDESQGVALGYGVVPRGCGAWEMDPELVL